jgi:hypothetical protein
VRRFVLCLVAACAFAPAAHAERPLAHYATAGCNGAPVWRIGYRLYFWSADGRSLSRGASAERSIAAAAQFAQEAGDFSRCGVRVSIDVYDMRSAVWPGAVPADNDAFRRAHGYDVTFYRYPRSGSEPFQGQTQYDTNASIFPVDDARPDNGFGSPWRNLLMHEWLHAVVHFYSHVRWPTNDVHGGAEHGYHSTTEGDMVNSGYFSDLMTGRVREQGALLGIRPGDWARYGTPAHPHALS